MKTGSLTPQLRDLGGSSPLALSWVEREYDLVRRVDGAGPGEFWLATQRENRQPATLRIVPRDAVSAEQATAWERNLILASRLAPHPHIAPVLAVEVSANRILFAAAQVEGDDVASLIRQTGVMPWEAAADCLRQTLAGLDHAHQHEVAHGDLKPSDLTIDWNGVVKIGNWANGAVSSSWDVKCAMAKDLRNAAQVLSWLLVGEESTQSQASGMVRNGSSTLALSPDEECSWAPDELKDIYQRLATAGSTRGFATAREAIAALDALDIHETTAVPVTRPLRGDSEPIDGAPENVAVAPEKDAEAPESRLAASDTRQPTLAAAAHAVPSDSPALAAKNGAAKLWRYGFVAAAVAALLAALLATFRYLFS